MRIAIVTGASSGMGAEFVRQLAREGVYEQIWAVARRLDRLEQLQQLIPCVRPMAVDLGDAAARTDWVETLKKEAPDVAVFVNCAGFGKYGMTTDLTEKEISDMIELNDKAAVLTACAVLPYMQQGARLILLGSASAFQPLPAFNLYAATKAFIVHFGRALAVEQRKRGVHVTTVCPGFVNTEFFSVAQQTRNPDTCRNFKPMYQSGDVVRKALADAKKGRDMSVLGANVTVQRLAAKVLPKAWIMRAWLKIK